MPSPWLAVGAETDPLARARQLQRNWERLLAEGSLGPELPPDATAGLRPAILESWRRSLGTGLDPVELVPPVEADQSEVRERWLEHPLGAFAHVLEAQLRGVAKESHSLVVVTDASGLLLHLDGAERLKDRAREMNFLEGGRFSEAADGTNGIGTALAADHALQVFAFEHFNQAHHQWVCSGAPVHDPMSGRIVGLVDLTSLWKIAHPRSLELVTTAAKTIERCLLDTRRDQEARLRRRYCDLMTRSTDLLVDRDGYFLDGDEQRRPAPLEVPEGGGEVALEDGSVAVAEPLGDGEAYLVRRPSSRGAKFASVETLERAEHRARDLAAEQAALREVATLVARQSSLDHLLSVVANQAARIFDVPLVLLARYERDGTFVVMGSFSERPATGSGGPLGLPVGSRWPPEGTGVTELIYQRGRPARVQDYALLAGERAAAMMRSGIRSAVGSPIVVEGRLWGVMAIGSPQPGSFPEDTEARLTDFAELIAMAIANAESHAALGQVTEEQAALRRVATMVARRVSPDELCSAVSNEVGRLVGAEAVIARFEPDGSAMVVVGLTPGIPVVTVGTRWQLEEFLASTVVYRTGRPARNDHTGHRDASGTVADSLRQMDFSSTVAVPITVEDRTWGVMTVSDKRRALPPETEERIERFTDLVGTAIANADSRWALGRLVEEQAALRRVATLVARAPASEELFSTVAREVASVLDVSGVIVTRYEADGTAVTLGEAFGPDLAGAERFLGVGAQCPPDPGSLAAQVHDTHGPARIDDFSTLPGTVGDLAREAGLGSGCAGPIVVNGSLWGKMCVFSRAGTVLPAGMENRLKDFVQLVASAIANYEAHTGLRTLADEQTALRRVATLVAEGAARDRVFDAVRHEVERMFDLPNTILMRFDADGMATLLATPGEYIGPIGGRWPLDGDNSAIARVHATGRPARSDYTHGAHGPLAQAARDGGTMYPVAVPVVVEGALWGAMSVGSSGPGPPPADIEARLAKFTGLLATAISNADSRSELAASETRARQLANEQAALRRVAMLVAKEAKPEEVFSAVAEEVEAVLGISVVTICRCEADGFLVIRSSGMPGFPAGSRWPWDVPSLPGLIYKTGRPARLDDFTNAVGLNAAARDAGVTAAVGVPIVVGGTVWGSICAATASNQPLPSDAEERLSRFRELVATSVSNATMREELAASRARIVAAGDDARRRIERDLHDGAQQRLVTLAVALQRAQAKIPSGFDELRADVTRVTDGLATAAEELREMSRGIHPAVLTEGGLSPALKALARRSAVRVKLDVPFEHRLPDQVEVAAYYTVSETLTNASKHAKATRVLVSLRVDHDVLHLAIRDDGIGGADPGPGSGLTGLRDRIEALGGGLQIESPVGSGTHVEVEIPIGQSTDCRGELDERPSPMTGAELVR